MPPLLPHPQVHVVASLGEAASHAPPGASVSLVVRDGLQVALPMAGLFDVAKEMARLEKQKAKVGPRERRASRACRCIKAAVERLAGFERAAPTAHSMARKSTSHGPNPKP